MSDAPRTDAEEWDAAWGNMVVDADFARTLERDLAEKDAKIAELEKALESEKRDAHAARMLVGMMVQHAGGEVFLTYQEVEAFDDRQVLSVGPTEDRQGTFYRTHAQCGEEAGE